MQQIAQNHSNTGDIVITDFLDAIPSLVTTFMYLALLVEIDSAEENDDIQAEMNCRCAIHVWLGIADKYWEGHWTVQSTLWGGCCLHQLGDQ